MRTEKQTRHHPCPQSTHGLDGRHTRKQPARQTWLSLGQDWEEDSMETQKRCLIHGGDGGGKWFIHSTATEHRSVWLNLRGVVCARESDIPEELSHSDLKGWESSRRKRTWKWLGGALALKDRSWIWERNKLRLKSVVQIFKTSSSASQGEFTLPLSKRMTSRNLLSSQISSIPSSLPHLADDFYIFRTQQKQAFIHYLP